MLRVPGRLAGAAIRWRASRIDDPVARLRFLRRWAGDRRPWHPATAENRRFLSRHSGKVALVLLALVSWQAAEISGSAARLSTLGGTPKTSAASAKSGVVPDVWLQEQSDSAEVWSNGLRVERAYEVGNEPRRYELYALDDERVRTDATAPVGIVYHTTESQLAPMDQDHSKRLRVIGRALLEYVKGKRAYHYVVDRFGRVWRVVREQDAANHAGYSVWSDAKFAYVNVNRSFLGVAVETQTGSEAKPPEATPAQVHALRLLTELLRSRYRIAAGNCVTHAQVSVNPSNFQVGYHYDWAAYFPFAEVGLPDNYSTAVPGLWLYGFTYDPSLVSVTGALYKRGLERGEERLRQDATANGMAPEDYRKQLQRRYRKILEQVKAQAEASAEAEARRAKETEG